MSNFSRLIIWIRFNSNKTQRIVFDKERIAKLALPRGCTQNKKRKRNNKSIDSSYLPSLIKKLK